MNPYATAIIVRVPEMPDVHLCVGDSINFGGRNSFRVLDEDGQLILSRTPTRKRWLDLLGLSVVSVLVGCAHWTKPEVAAEALALAATATDWMQTEGITAACQEGNFVIGECGQNIAPRYYFPLAMVGHLAIAAVLPHRYRLAWSTVLLGSEANQVWMNQFVATHEDLMSVSRSVLTVPPPRRLP